MSLNYEAWKQEQIRNGTWEDRAPRFLMPYSRTADRDPHPRVPFTFTDPQPIVTTGEAVWATVVAVVVLLLVTLGAA